MVERHQVRGSAGHVEEDHALRLRREMERVGRPWPAVDRRGSGGQGFGIQQRRQRQRTQPGPGSTPTRSASKARNYLPCLRCGLVYKTDKCLVHGRSQ